MPAGRSKLARQFLGTQSNCTGRLLICYCLFCGRALGRQTIFSLTRAGRESRKTNSRLVPVLKRKAGLTMEWWHAISYFFGGAFLSNAIPHFVSGVMGRPFQSPFAKPPGQGLSSSTVNVLWGFLNLAVSYVLICRVGDFRLRSATQVVVLGLGFLLMGLMAARGFGRFHGGNSPRGSDATTH